MKLSRTQLWLTVGFGIVLTAWVGTTMVVRQSLGGSSLGDQYEPEDWLFDRAEQYAYFNELLMAIATADSHHQTYLDTGDDEALALYGEQVDRIEGDRIDFFEEAFGHDDDLEASDLEASDLEALETLAELGEAEEFDDLDREEVLERYDDDLEDTDWDELEQRRLLGAIDTALTARLQRWDQAIQQYQTGPLPPATRLSLIQQGRTIQIELQEHLQDVLVLAEDDYEGALENASLQRNNALWISWLTVGLGVGTLTLGYGWLMRTLGQHTQTEQKRRALAQTVKEQKGILRKTQAELRTELNRRQELEATCQAIEEAKELTDLKLNFFSLASHELRTPLSAILVSAQLLDNPNAKWTEEKRSRNLRRIQSSAKTMTQLLADILLLTRAEAGKLEFNPQMIELEDFCQKLVEEVSFNTQAQHQITVSRKGNCECAYLDESLIRAMLMSVLTNAIKYSPPESEITFTVYGEVDRTLFQIRDQGIGIPAADQKYLFESFRRGQNVKSISGTGLGLAVVKKCLDLHGGSIDVESEVGIGTRFSIDVPWADQSPDPKRKTGIRVSGQLSPN